VLDFAGEYEGPIRKLSVASYTCMGSIILPGFMALVGSNNALNSRKASMSSGPNIFGNRKPRACPSPCSPENEPPYLRTISAASSTNWRKFATPRSLAKSKVMRK
jgi:hypothetical protein